MQTRLWMTGRDDIEELRQIRSESRGGTIETDWLRVKYGDPQAPVIAAVATHAGHVGAIVSFGVNRYECQDRALSVAVSYDTYVTPSLRGGGLFSRLRSEAEEAVQQFGVDLLLNAPNSQSRRGFEKGGWSPFGALHAYVRPSLTPVRRMPRRLYRGLGSRGRQLVPERGFVVTDGDLLRYSALSDDSNEFRMMLEGAQLKRRFHPHRGDGYTFIEAGNSAALVRVGRRANAREAHFMAFAPRRPSAGSLRALTREAERELAPDVTSFVAAADPALGRAARSSGFVRTGISTVFYTKNVQYPSPIGDHLLTGVDVHTW